MKAAWPLAAALLLFTGCGGTSQSSRSDGLRSRSPEGTAPCASSEECTNGQTCTTEDGVCDPPPGCDPGSACATVCYGTCRAEGQRCGAAVCSPGKVCCNASCGICTSPGEACIQVVCEPPSAGT